MKGLSLRDIETGFVQGEERPALVCDDAMRARPSILPAMSPRRPYS
jgi:hypothetical protein